jgi:DNA-binding MarR family transcriptional regulator
VNRITASKDDARIESIYRAAERRAEALHRALPAHTEADNVRPIAESSLVREAAMECERHLIRKRFLPRDLSSEWAWTILLDVFVNEQHTNPTNLSHLASKRGLSQLTTARQIAALIEYGLIIIDKDVIKFRESNFKTTTEGRSVVTKVLNAFQNIAEI